MMVTKLSVWMGCLLLGLGCSGSAGDSGAGGSAGFAGASGASAGSAGSSGAEPERDAGPATPDAGPPPALSSALVERVRTAPVDKLDLLLVVDNSYGMADKQALLRSTIEDLVTNVVNPVCLDAQGAAFPPPLPGQPCPEGQQRAFPAITDLNIGIVSSSMGDGGANAACPEEGFAEYRPDRIDRAHLVGSLGRAPSPAASGATPEGFLAWRAGAALAEFHVSVQQMLDVVGERGCAFEQPLESWYRFLVDPYPYESLVRVVCPGSGSQSPLCVQQRATPDGRLVLDTELLAQRAAFLRPDSLVAVVVASDENDCSTQVGNQSWVVHAIDDARPMFRGSSTCDADPNGKCCFSCPLGPPDGCPEDPICNADPANDVLANRLPANEDGRNLRCYQQRRRFGIDFLFPMQRYVNALREPELCWYALDLASEGCSAADLVPNPLYSGGRSRQLVFFGAIVGVPWQAIAASTDPEGRPLPDAVLRFQSPSELGGGETNTWDWILGSPGVPWRAADDVRPEVTAVPGVPPQLPQMIESEFARPGVATGNALNGREYDTILAEEPAGTPDDLQYACIFPLSTPRDCSAVDPVTGPACNCFPGSLDNPTCEEQPGVSTPGTTQYWGKAYPGTRQIELSRAHGANSVLGSICARNVNDPTAQDYAYRPSMAALVERFSEQLRESCLPAQLPFDAEAGQTPCQVVEASAPLGRCTCDAASARRVPAADVQASVRARLARARSALCDGDPDCTSACLCEVQAVEAAAGDGDAALRACREEQDVSGLQGWCYLDAELNVGSASLVAACPPTQRRRLRFVGQPPARDTFTICPSAESAPGG